MNNLVYKRRIGTSGVSGQLYETKLLSLILFRALHDDDIEEFYIGTNVDGLGEFDDICIRFKVRGFDKPVAVFLQAKHRDDQRRPLAVTKTDLTKYFKSYINVRNKFNVSSSDVFFKDAYDDVECAFVFYTNTTDELDKTHNESNYISKINDIISTGDDAFQLPYTDDDVKLLNQMVLHSMIGKLAILLADVVSVKGENYGTLMNNELMQTYHVILSQRVFIESDAQQDENTDYRMARFNPNFFNTDDEHLLLLVYGLVYERLRDNTLRPQATVVPLTQLSFEPSLHTAIKLISTVITSNSNISQYDDENIDDGAHMKADLKETVNVVKSSFERFVDSAHAEYGSKSFKLPTAFGNRDLTLSGGSSRKEKRLCYLANKLITLLKESNVQKVNDTFNIVRIDDDFPDKGFLRLNGGIAGAVGNLLMFDKRTRLLMFQDGDHLAGHAKTLFNKLNSEVKELEKYRLDVRVQNFPKLSFDCNEHDKSMVVDFTNRLLFCTNQARQSGVEDILKRDIGRLQNAREKCNFQIKSDAIFLAYHDEIQKYWLSQEYPKYLTKTCRVFQHSIERFIRNPLLSVANVLSKNKIIKHDIKFDTGIVNLFKLDESFSKITILVSESVALSVVKVTQYIKNDDYILIDLNYMLGLPESDRDRLHEELTNVDDKIFILTYRLSQVSKVNKDVKDILQTLKRKKLIVITNNGSLSHIKKFLVHTYYFMVDDKSSLVDLTRESQETITRNTDVIFQGVHVNLSLLVDDEAKVFVKGELMDEIMSGEVIRVGEPLTTSRYEEIKDLYVSRIVTPKCALHSDDFNRTQQVEIKLETLLDIDDRAVLIIAEPGMGKSSLLTHLSLTTKARDPGVWIVRINLLDYSRYFHQWADNKAGIDILEALTFICVALVKQNVDAKLILSEKNGEIYIKHCCIETDKQIMFQINMFLHYFNRREVIFTFDGFDEICPHYEPLVIQLLCVLKQHRPREHRIWVTSRTYSKILRSLESVFGVTHQLEPFNFKEQHQFIERYLKLKLDLNKLNERQIDKINDFIAFLKQSWPEDFSILYNCHSLPLHTVYLDAAQYFKDEIKHVLHLQNKEKYVKSWNLNVQAMTQKRGHSGSSLIRDKTEFIASPLHIYMVADYFQHQINHVETDTVWDLNINTYAMYEHFVETKFRKIRFEEKNQMDVYKPDVQLTFEREKKKFINDHKKLAAYAMFYEDVDRLFSQTELEEIRKIVSTISSGVEKTGVIHTVIDGVPRFVHLTFAEYFAVEYICDILKTEQPDDDLKSLWNFVLNTVFYRNNVGVLYVLDDKLNKDEELKGKVRDARSKRIIFDLLMAQSAGETENVDDHYMENTECKIHSSLHEAVIRDLRNLTSLFLSTLEYITPENVHHLVQIITDTKAIAFAVIIANMDFIKVTLDTVRRVDPSKIGVLFCKLPRWRASCDGDTPNDVIVDITTRYLVEEITKIFKLQLKSFRTQSTDSDLFWFSKMGVPMN